MEGPPSDPPAPGVNAILSILQELWYGGEVDGLQDGIEVWTMAVLYPLESMTTYEGTARKDVEVIRITLATHANRAPEHCIKMADLVTFRKRAGIWCQDSKGPRTTTLFLSGW